MVQYRRSQTPGGTYFFTVNLRDRTSQYLTTYIDDLRKAFHDVRQRRAFKIVAVCILPEHIHMVMELPSGDSDYPGRW
ncbi:MAG: transposase, partial [Colwellia sp.]|nr:transposase [Colwellia sp.]